MAAPHKYPDELRERATRMVLDLLEEDPTSRRGVVRRVDDELGVNLETLRGWVHQAQIDAGTRQGPTTVDALRLAELEERKCSTARRIASAAGTSLAARSGAHA